MITIDGGTGTILHNGVNVAAAPMVDQWRITDDTGLVHIALGQANYQDYFHTPFYTLLHNR